MASDVSREEISTRRGRLVGVHRRLEQARPVVERVTNEYVETPLRSTPHPAATSPSTTTTKHDAAAVARTCRHSDFALVTLPAISPSVSPSLSLPSSDGIICRECGKCRCADCGLSRPLPSLSCCDSACICSGTTVVDTATCMCVPKAVWYHCTNDEESRSQPSNLCLALSTLLFPCLLCYLPCQWVHTLCEECYSWFKTPGCRCRRVCRQSEAAPPTPGSNFEKRLLDMD